MRHYLLLAVAAALSVSACGKKEEAKPHVPQRPPLNQEESKKIPVPVPPAPVPGPSVPKMGAGSSGQTSAGGSPAAR